MKSLDFCNLKMDDNDDDDNDVYPFTVLIFCFFAQQILHSSCELMEHGVELTCQKQFCRFHEITKNVAPIC